MTCRRATLFTTALLLSTLPFSAFGQPDEEPEEIDRISIDELIAVAIRNAPKLAKARADVKVARGDEQVARGKDDWKVNIDLSAKRSTRLPVAGQPVQTTADEQFTGEGGLARDLPSGGELTVGLAASRTKEEFRSETGMEMEAASRASKSRVTQARAKMGLRHSLLAGFGRDIARADLERAGLQKSAAELRAQSQGAELIREIINGYWELAHAALVVEVKRTSLKSARELFKETQSVVRIGRRPKSDLQAAEYSVLTREESLLIAEITLQEQALSLRRAAGLEIGPKDIALLPVDLPKVSNKRFPVGKMVKRTLKQNPGLAALELEGKGAKIEVRVAKNGKKPRLEFTLQGSVGATGRNVDSAIRALSDEPQYEVSAGMSFSFDIGGNVGKGNYLKALGRQQTALIDAEELRREVASSTVLAIHRIRAARKRVEVSAKSIELAMANLRAERARFSAGTVSSRELYQRQDEIDDARINRARALADYHQSIAALLGLTGDLLRTHKVKVIK